MYHREPHQEGFFVARRRGGADRRAARSGRSAAGTTSTCRVTFRTRSSARAEGALVLAVGEPHRRRGAVYPAEPVAAKYGARGGGRHRPAARGIRAVQPARRPAVSGRLLARLGLLRATSKSGSSWPSRRTSSTQALDLELSWSERALPEHVRTKHVHRLHPYHGKFIPQLVEVLLDRYFTRGAPRARSVCRLRDDARTGARVGATTRRASSSPRSTAC